MYGLGHRMLVEFICLAEIEVKHLVRTIQWVLLSYKIFFKKSWSKLKLFEQNQYFRCCKFTTLVMRSDAQLLSSNQWVSLDQKNQANKLYNRGFAQQPCCIAGTIDSFSYGTKNVLSYFHYSCHATWLTCKTSIAKAAFSFYRSLHHCTCKSNLRLSALTHI